MAAELPKKKRARPDEVVEENVQLEDEEETWTFPKWVDWSKNEIGFTSLKAYLTVAGDDASDLSDDLEIKLLGLSQSITVRSEQLVLKNLLPIGFTAEYENTSIKEGTVMYQGDYLQDKQALQYVALYQLAIDLHSYNTILLGGGAALIIQPHRVDDGKYITNASVLKLTSGPTYVLTTTANILLGLSGSINPFHYKQATTKAIVCNRYFSEYSVTEEQLSAIQKAVESGDRKTLLEKGSIEQKSGFQNWIRELDTLLLTSTTMTELCQPSNLETFTLKQLLHMVTTQQRLKCFFRIKAGRKFFLNDDTTEEVVMIKLSEATELQELVVTTNSMSYVGYSRLHPDTEVMAVPKGTKQLHFLGKGKTRMVYTKDVETMDKTDPVVLCNALSELAKVVSGKNSKKIDPAVAASSTEASANTAPAVIKVDSSMFDA